MDVDGSSVIILLSIVLGVDERRVANEATPLVVVVVSPNEDVPCPGPEASGDGDEPAASKFIRPHPVGLGLVFRIGEYIRRLDGLL